MGPQLSLIIDIITYLIPGIIVFILIPSGIISYFEQWTFDESVYFAFVTLTTIGYGDYVAGMYVLKFKHTLVQRLKLITVLLFERLLGGVIWGCGRVATGTFDAVWCSARFLSGRIRSHHKIRVLNLE